jgi:mRNA interferase RelE/StbE
MQSLPVKVLPAMWEVIGLIADNPFRMGAALRRELVGEFAARRGPFRVLYRIDTETDIVEIRAVAHRSKSYRRR